MRLDFPTGSIIDICAANGVVKETRRVLLAVWRSNGTTVCYVADSLDGS
jgi:hypothetical protein